MMMGLRWLEKGRGGDAAGAVVLGNLMAFAVGLPFALPVAPRPADVAILVFLGVFQIGLAYPLVLSALRRLSALEASLLLLVEPVLNPVWAWLAHGERAGTWALAGGAVILAATALRTWREPDPRGSG
jgi:drug/metabolite transporter (DMT)-like permease